MSQSPTHRNAKRIQREIDRVVDALDGPVPSGDWEQHGGEAAKEAFKNTVKKILGEELDRRAGENTTVNVNIKAHLTSLGSKLADLTGATPEGSND